jgi:hypothetical protein
MTEWNDPMSYWDQRSVNSEIFDYLGRKAFSIPVEYPIRINVKGSKLPEMEKDRIKSMVREHYTLDLWEQKINARKNWYTTIGLAVLGAVLLVIAFGMDRAVYGDVLSEMLMIVATFTFWEAADYFLLVRSEIQIQRLYAGQMATADIIFEEEKE